MTALLPCAHRTGATADTSAATTTTAGVVATIAVGVAGTTEVAGVAGVAGAAGTAGAAGAAEVAGTRIAPPAAASGRSAARRTALLVIDAQQSFVDRPYWSADELPAYLAAQNALIQGCAARGVPVVRVLHVEPEGAFSIGSGLVTPLAGLAPFDAALTVHKPRHSALVDTPLGAWLADCGIGRLVVSGIRTEQCCETTTRHASDLGFSVDYCTAATLTFAMTHAASGERFEPAAIRRRTELVLADRFATIVGVPEALQRLTA